MKIEKRKDSLRLVRDMNKVPGVLYGKSISPISIQINESDLHELIKKYGYTKTFKINLGKESHTVYIKEVQYDIIKRNFPLNVKFQKVIEGDTIKASVPLNIIGREAVEKSNTIVQVVSDFIDVEYPIGKGLTNIDVDVSNMKVGDSLQVKDLKLPEYLIVHDDEDKILISVTEVTYVEEKETTEEVDITDVEVEKEKTEE